MAKVDIHYFHQALDCAVRKGFDGDKILLSLGITITPNQQRVDGEQMTRLVQYVWANLNDEFLGCTKNPCKTGIFPFMAHHVFHYKSLGKMLEQGILFYNLVTNDMQMKLVRGGDVAELEFVFTHPECDPKHFFLEFWLIIWHRFSSWLIDVKIPLSQVCFSHPKPKHSQEVKLLFSCRHSFNRPVVKLCFHAKYLDLPCVRTRKELTRFLRNSPEDLITIPGSGQSFKAKIRAILIHDENDILYCPSFERLALNLNMSAQTLRRRLKVEGTSYPMIKDEIRRDLAIDYLVMSNRNITDISNILGFSEPRSFTRAFKHWTGVSPSKYSRSKV
ncbi:AraC family transcriptional regulator [Colwellia demingiae]|uniref:AraC family transcriptional regulator n=1 Tax=Colwellia demingiae TaxID=89401 RepID=A0A5C6Q5X3_9GAMM|nr:AraC family transcriptional regulator [Colwellia demingiae]TWX64101.1 AraC family transcriptional regulator [Colwellia demingiae]